MLIWVMPGSCQTGPRKGAQTLTPWTCRHGTMRGMRHFGFLDPADRSRLFHHEPREFTLEAEPERIGVALGATLYCPATRPRLAHDIQRRAAAGVVSVVVCLEDAVPDGQ